MPVCRRVIAHISGIVFLQEFEEEKEMELVTKPDYESALKRIEAWFAGEIIDRPPVRFTPHNEFVNQRITKNFEKSWKTVRDKWFDTEFQIENFKQTVKQKTYLAETFPVFWPDLGPDVYAAFFGCDLIYGKETSWSMPCIDSLADITKLQFSKQNEYFKKIVEMTEYAITQCGNKYIVGYTDLHPGYDCAMAWRGSENLCMDLYDNPLFVEEMLNIAQSQFYTVYDYFNSILTSADHPSVNWMEIPIEGKLHIPSCDFSTFVSEEYFKEKILPHIQDEVKSMSHNIFHLDGPGVAKNVEAILEIPQIHAIQLVQGVAEDRPIMQWVPLVEKIQAAGKSVVVDLLPNELDHFTRAVQPEGIFLCLPVAELTEAQDILKKIEKWV